MSRILRESLETFVGLAKCDHFEDGMISRFEENLHTLYKEWDNKGDFLGILFAVLTENAVGDVLHEALKILARLEDPSTEFLYRDFIQRHLGHDDYVVRDGALTAIEYMDNPESLPVLMSYVQYETRGYLRRYAWEIIKQMAPSSPTVHVFPLQGECPPVKSIAAAPQFELVDAIGVSLTPELVIPIPGKPPVITY